MINVALIGAGGMGRVHLRCYRNNPDARVVAICDVSAPQLREAGEIALSKNPAVPDPMSLAGVTIYDRYEELLRDERVRLVDVCLPTPLHAPVVMAALEAGTDVFCEKPLGLTVEQCQAMLRSWRASGRQMTVGHSLRYMPQYTVAHELMASGKYGRAVYARFHRSGGLPVGSFNNWLVRGSDSGGVALDLHVHDIDVAHWWFGAEHTVQAQGIVRDDLVLKVDSSWQYAGQGPLVHLHAGWDISGGLPFRFAFYVMMERGSVAYDSEVDRSAVRLYEPGAPMRQVPFADTSPNQLQVNDIVEALQTGRRIERVTPEDGARAVAVAREAMQQIARQAAERT
jgi:predicted dehydrogenase